MGPKLRYLVVLFCANANHFVVLRAPIALVYTRLLHQLIIQSLYSIYLCFSLLLQWASTTVARCWRTVLARRRFLKTRASVRKLQRVWRGYHTRIALKFASFAAGMFSESSGCYSLDVQSLGVTNARQGWRMYAGRVCARPQRTGSAARKSFR